MRRLTPIENRAKMIQQMLFVCPHLRALTVVSTELVLCLRQNPALAMPSLNHLHLYLDKVHDMVDPVTLAAVFPNISFISTGKDYLVIDINLCQLVLHLIKALPYLRRLHFGDYNFSRIYDIDQSDNNLLVEILQSSEQLRSTNSCVRVYGKKHLAVWL
jgi:hypothetical protein